MSLFWSCLIERIQTVALLFKSAQSICTKCTAPLWPTMLQAAKLSDSHRSYIYRYRLQPSWSVTTAATHVSASDGCSNFAVYPHNTYIYSTLYKNIEFCYLLLVQPLYYIIYTYIYFIVYQTLCILTSLILPCNYVKVNKPRMAYSATANSWPQFNGIQHDRGIRDSQLVAF